MTYATDWRYTPVPRDGVLRSTHHLIMAKRAEDGSPITLAEVEGDRDENLDPRMSDAEQAAIARLMAAAPELLAALRAIADSTDAGAMIGVARYAIAKAEGKP